MSLQREISSTLSKDNDEGFTLLEMMVVIMIIGMLAGLVVPNLLGNKDKADQQKALADIISLENAVELYQMEKGAYPSPEEGLKLLTVQDPDTSEGAYIKRLPDDPWHHPYQYRIPGKFGAFDIFSLGADNKQGGKGINKDIGNWNINDK